MKLVVDRTRWLRGHDSALMQVRKRNSTYAKCGCILGLYCEAIGVDEEQLIDETWPSSLLLYHDVLKNAGLLSGDGDDSEFTNDVISANDEPLRNALRHGFQSEAEREQYLIKHFKTVGVELEFIN